jgi:hypothetical protein
MRKKAVEARERALGAASVVTVDMQASDAGTGEFDLKVSAGCHSFDLLSNTNGGVDVDATLRSSASQELLDEDRRDTPDAHLETCVAEVTELSLRFSGAKPSNRVFATDSLFEWPSFIGDRWGARVRATWANLVRRKHLASPASLPIAEVLGGQGSSLSYVDVEPGRCYLAMVALSRGRSRGVRLSASASARPSIEEATQNQGGASVVFCSEDQDLARVRVEAPSSSATWVLSVWPLGSSEPNRKP